MKRFETRKAMLEEVGQRAKELASNYLTWPPDYDDLDLEEIWGHVRASGEKLKDVGGTLFTKTRKLPRARTKLRPKSIELLERMATHTGKLGFDVPVPVKKLGEELLKLDKYDSKDVIQLTIPSIIQYPFGYTSYEGLYVWLTDSMKYYKSIAGTKNHLAG